MSLDTLLLAAQDSLGTPKEDRSLLSLLAEIGCSKLSKGWKEKALQRMLIDTSTREPWLKRHAQEVSGEKGTCLRYILSLLKLNCTNTGYMISLLHKRTNEYLDNGNPISAAKTLNVLYDISYVFGKEDDDFITLVCIKANKTSNPDILIRAISWFLAGYPPYFLVRARTSFRKISGVFELAEKDNTVLQALR